MYKIPYARVDCSGNEYKYVKEVLDSGWLTTASKTHKLEENFKKIVGAKHALAVNSCTSALHLALEAVGVQEGDKVLVPTWTFTASAEIIRYLGADPVFLDVDYETSSLTPEIVAESIERYPDAKVLIVVHFAGQAAPMGLEDTDEIMAICRKNGIIVVEDAAHAFPSRCGNQYVGNIGDVTCFSFYANKTMTTGEGGMLTTNKDDIAERVKLMRLHGIDRDVWDRFTSSKVSWEYDIRAPGYKYNMPDINAAVGLAQLEQVFDKRDKRQHCAEFYLDNLKDIEAVDLPKIRVPLSDHAWHIFAITLNNKAQVSRNDLIKLLAEDGIGTSVHYKPLHRMSYYKEKYALENAHYPNSEKLWKGCISLPIYSGLSDEELKYICDRVRVHLKL